MSGISICISEPLCFSTQSKAIAYFSEVLNRHNPGDWLSETDEMEVLQLFQHHPASEEKLQGRKIIGVEVNRADHGTQCFYLRLGDGSVEHFSYKTCIKAIAKRSK